MVAVKLIHVDDSQRQESYKLAFSFFNQALKRDPKCAYAANGIAMLMADSGDMDGAHYLFNLLRESTSEEPSVLINCGHTLVELKRYREAIAMVSNISPFTLPLSLTCS